MLKHILVVEDDPDISEIIEYILSDSGYEVDTSATATEFFRRFEELNPDLIILDVRLPDGDGRELCKAIKSNIKTRSIPVIMMSAHLDITQAIKEAGANDFIPKPFDINNFINRVGRQLTAA